MSNDTDAKAEQVVSKTKTPITTQLSLASLEVTERGTLTVRSALARSKALIVNPVVSVRL